jgi:hypothetical protein
VGRSRGVVSLQRRFRVVGRLKMGEQVPTGKVRKDGTPILRPKATSTWRMTTYGDVGRTMLEEAAQLYGGQVKPWEQAPEPGGWELATETDSVDVLVPPAETPFSVSLELWTAAGCARRCDGETCEVYRGRGQGWRKQGCMCEDPEDPTKRECSIHMRFGVILPRVAGLGVWAVNTHSFHGTEELMGSLSVLGLRAMDGLVTPAHLRIEPRSTRRPFVNAQGETEVEVSRFPVMVLDVPSTVAELMSGTGERVALEGPGPRTRAAIGAGGPPPPATRLEGGAQAAPVRGEVLPVEPEEPLPATAPPPPAGEAAKRPPKADVPITDDQRRGLHDLTAELGLRQDELKRILREETGQESTSAVPAGKLEGIRRRMHEVADGNLPGTAPPPSGGTEPPG